MDPLSAGSFTADPVDKLSPFGAIPMTKHHHPSHTPMSNTLIHHPPLPLPCSGCPELRVRLQDTTGAAAAPQLFTSHLLSLLPTPKGFSWQRNSSGEKFTKHLWSLWVLFCTPALHPPDIPSLVSASRRAHQAGKTGNAPLNTSEGRGSPFQALVPPVPQEQPTPRAQHAQSHSVSQHQEPQLS